MERAFRVVLALVGGALLLSTCGSTSPTTTTTGSTSSTSSTTSIASVTQDLVVTPAVRLSLLDAAAAYHQLPASDYVGLDTGTTYYAFDPATKLYYAAAGLDPSPNSLQVQVGAQDDGAYNLFTKTSPPGTWKVYDDGLGAAQDSTCPVVIPAAVLAVWNWKPKSCYPPS